MNNVAIATDQVPPVSPIDETTGIMIYGSVRIVDIDTSEILVNKRI